MLMLLLIVTNIVLVTHEGEFARINRALHSQLSRQRIPVVSGYYCYLCHGRYVFSGVSSFVDYQDYGKATEPIFTKFCGKVAYGTRNKRLDFGGNPDHDMPRSLRVTVR